MTTLSFLSNLAGPDIAILAIVFLLLFGARLLPRWAKSLRETKDELNKLQDDE